MSATSVELRDIPHGSPEYRAAVELRSAILRRPIGLAFSADELAAEATSHHIGCYEDGSLAGCLVLKPIDGKRIQMRQLAVDPERQRRGVGRRMVEYAEGLARKLGCEVVVLHAREAAVPFYERLGYTRSGDSFTEVTLPHWTMEKTL